MFMEDQQKQIIDLGKGFAVLNTQFLEFREEIKLNFKDLKENYSVKIEQIKCDLENIDKIKLAKADQDSINDSLFRKVEAINIKVDKAFMYIFMAIGGIGVIEIILQIMSNMVGNGFKF